MLRLQLRNFDKFAEQLMHLKKEFPEELEQFLIDTAKALNRSVRKRTPVLHGDLKREWKISAVTRDGDKMYITIYNDATTKYEGRTVPLAPFVEFGHRITTKDGKTVGKVDGFYMLTTSIKAVNKQIPRRLRKVFDRLVDGL
jgi:Bacteriophage HK97-gp10, putative tail-component